MTADLGFLVEEACPLVPTEWRSRLIHQYNLAVEMAQAIGRSYPEDRLPEGLSKILSELARIKESLTRRSYCVGFLGPFQAGKSSTFNNVLNAAGSGLEPARVGHGFPTTAVITRLVRTTGEEHRLRPVFLSSSEYDEKRRFLIELAGFASEQRDEVILQKIPAILRDWNKGVRTRIDSSGNEVPVRRRDVEYLALFLKSYARHKSRIMPTRMVLDDVPFSDRAKYLQHPPDPWDQQDGIITPLLREVIIEFHTDIIPDTLELLDLPGYDGDCSVDAFLTDQFLKTLQASFVFCRATDFGGIVETIVSNLRHVLGNDLRGRVWLVITRCDDINIHEFQSINDRNIFEQIRLFAESKGIPSSQVLFVTNDLAGFRGRLDQGWFQEQLEKSLRAASERWPGLKNQWNSLTEDGGIGALRQLITKQVADQISDSIARFAAERLPNLCDRLFAHLRQLADEKLLGELPERITAWRTQLLQATAIKPADFRRLSEQLFSDLLEKWTAAGVQADILDSGLAREGNKPLCEEFAMHAYMLDSAISSFLQTRWTDLAYSPIFDAIQSYENSRGRLELPGVCDSGVAAYLEMCHHRDQRDLSWANGQIPSFKANNPFENLPSESAPIYSGEEYLAVVKRKLRAVSQQISLLLLLRVRANLLELLRRIRDYGLALYQKGDISLPADWSQLMQKFEREIEMVR